MKRWICLLALAAITPAGHPAAQEPDDFLVVVNAANETAPMDRSRVSRMFLKQVRTWPDSGELVKLVDQSERSMAREAFTRAIHRKKVSAITSYWQRRIFSGRDVPPRELGSDQEVLDFVRGDPCAIGYVTKGADLGAGVKELTVTE